jgi:hypothetical protein
MARPHARTLLALLSLALGACGDGPPTEGRTVAGFVTDGADRSGVRGAEVTFTSDTRYTASATTDGDGYYEIRVETDSDFGQVMATHPEYGQSAEATVFFDTVERRIDLVLRR